MINLRGGDLGALIVRIDADLSNLQKGLTKSQAEILTTSQKINRTLIATTKVVAGLGIAFIVLAGVAAAQAIKFEDAFAGVRKTVDATEEEFRRLSKRLIDLSTEIPVAATELAKIQQIAGQLGVRGVENLTKFTKTIAQLSETTDLTSERAAFAFSRIAGLTRTPIDQIETLGSVVVELGNNFRTTESEITEFALRIAATGTAAGLTSTEIFAISTAFTEAGIQAERGGTAINRVLVELQKEGKQGIGAFNDFLQTLVDSGDQAAVKLEELGFSSVRLQQAFLSVAVQGGRFKEILKAANDETLVGTALQIEFDKRLETTASQLRILKGNLLALAIDFGETFLPIINSATAALRNFFEELRIKDQTDIEFLESKILELTDAILDRRTQLRSQFGESIILADKELEALEEQLAVTERLLEFKRESKALDEDTTIEDLGADGSVVPSIDEITALRASLTTMNEEAFQKTVANLLKEQFLTLTTEQQKTKIVEDETKKRNKQKDLEAKTNRELFNSFSGILSAFVGESKAAAIALKILRIGEILIEGQKAIALIQATIPLPLQPPFIAKQRISTALQVATVAAIGFQTGTDSVPSLLTPGEMVVPQTFADAIRSGDLTLGGGGTTNNNERNVVIENIEINVNENFDTDIIPDIVTELNTEIQNELRSV